MGVLFYLIFSLISCDLVVNLLSYVHMCLLIFSFFSHFSFSHPILLLLVFFSSAFSLFPLFLKVQIHGPVSLSENVDCIVVNRKYKGNKAIEKLLDQFIDKNNCNLIWMSEAEDPLHLVGVASCYHGDYGHGYYGDDYSDSEEEDYYSDEYYYDENDL